MKNDILEFALSLAQAAEAEILPVYRKCAVHWKPDGTEVTDADRRAEEVMREIIAKRMPGHQVLGEEYGGPDSPTREPLWVLDPIDGTRSFALGLPIFGTLIGYLENGEPQAGVIHFPAMGETVYAARGSGCWMRLRDEAPQPARAAGTTDVRSAYLSACGVNPSDIDPAPSGPCYKLSALIRHARRFRFVSDCVQHALVAEGRLDAAVDAIMNPWDIAAIVPCVEEAGGVVTDLEGQRENIVWRSSLLSSATPALHGEILSILRSGRKQ
ncbi:MAG TPA: inositol monophosphatase family protein [Terriglobia bacterium]|nr:inositol monophosphatase family protein [Terriglobia bacterium]